MSETPQIALTLDSLSDEQLNLKVARILGWKFKDHCWEKGWHDDKGDGPPPNFVSDLNACAEFEKCVPQYSYGLQLLIELGEAPDLSSMSVDRDDFPFVAFKVARATAEQRCRAFVTVSSPPSPAESENKV